MSSNIIETREEMINGKKVTVKVLASGARTEEKGQRETVDKPRKTSTRSEEKDFLLKAIVPQIYEMAEKDDFYLVKGGKYSFKYKGKYFTFQLTENKKPPKEEERKLISSEDIKNMDL